MNDWTRMICAINHAYNLILRARRPRWNFKKIDAENACLKAYAVKDEETLNAYREAVAACIEISYVGDIEDPDVARDIERDLKRAREVLDSSYPCQ